MRDFARTPYRSTKVAPNKSKVQRKPLNLKKYLRPLRWVAAGAGILGLLALVVYGSWRAIAAVNLSPLKNIEVTETRRVTREDLIAVSGIAPGMDLVRLNLKHTSEHIMQNPWVETVHVRRFFPDTISITVTEHEPVAVVNMGYLYYLDAKGTVFKVLSQGDRLDYPVITGFSDEDLHSDPSGTKNALLATCELLNILREKGAFILADVSEIHYDKGYGFTMFTSSGSLPIKIGSTDFDAKIARFSKIYYELMAQRAGLHYIDLDYQDKIVVKKS